MKQFSSVAKLLHWSVAGLIVSQYVLAKLAENAKLHERILEQLALLANHKSVGITILVFAAVRLIYRLNTPSPELPSSMTSWQVRASKASHFLLYGFLFALPISGWLMSSAKAYSVSWFNLLALPDFVAPNDVLAERLHSAHYYLAEALFVVALIHIFAALKHHFIDKDDVLKRMSNIANWVLFVLVITLVVGLLGRFFVSSPTVNPPSEAGAVSQAQVASNDSQLVKSDLPLWSIDYDQSYIKFTADQAGAPFEGEWQKWAAEIQFDAEQLDKARFNVTIDLSSGFSNDQERDDTIRSAEFFDVVSFPDAYYRAVTFSKTADAFQSIGALSMKGTSIDAALSFDVVESNGAKILTGSATLDRLRWNIGTGDWQDTSWVGQNVMVEVRVVSKL